MPKIFELLGYPVSDNSSRIVETRKRAYCPFVSGMCDGGGNRYMSDIDLRFHPELKKMFPGLNRVPSGICSIQLSETSAPWIICPRRLLYMGEKANQDVLMGETQTRLIELCGFPKGIEIGIWTEVKVKYSKDDSDYSAFDYTFDYVLMPLGCVSQEQAIEESCLEWKQLQKNLRDCGHTFSQRNGKSYIEDFPIGSPIIVEVMTSSTSGGNKKKRSCIPQAFEDCMLGKTHTAPGINYRQVWARMASQLIVKSQAAMAWNGKTIWVLQDLLADYISSSTALNLHQFIADHTDEVNILAFSYGDNYRHTEKNKTVSLNNSVLYAGQIRSGNSNKPKPCFQDIVLAPICPPRSSLIAALSKKKLVNRLVV
ncbi:MAG: hypothetical protein IJT30_02835 [Muribaculaceae bacterium]|nr:hypothetical protein [Muribaculaceae bacterium]